MTHSTGLERYAIYGLPDGALMRAGSDWLGWDIEAGAACAQPDPLGLPLAASQITDRPRRYGLHATLKAPFRLAPGKSAGALGEAMDRFAAATAPVSIPGLAVRRMGRFLALAPGDTGDKAPGITALAASIVRAFDPFRAALTEADRMRRKKAGLTPAQEQNLEAWGYPYVMEAFRFHITLSGPLPPETIDAVEHVLVAHFTPLVENPFVLRRIGLCVEGPDGHFRLVQAYPLRGGDTALADAKSGQG